LSPSEQIAAMLAEHDRARRYGPHCNWRGTIHRASQPGLGHPHRWASEPTRPIRQQQRSRLPDRSLALPRQTGGSDASRTSSPLII
jgi:hypothetical protein